MMNIWQISPDSDRYRSFHVMYLSPGEVLDVVELFRCGQPIRKVWAPVHLELFEYKGEERKPIGDFASGIGTTVPLPISARALEILSPLIQENAEILDLITEMRKFYALNTLFCDCLDHARSVFTRFSDGGIMRVETYGFRPDSLTGKHIFRIPEIWGYTFVDDTFKRTVEENQLGGLLFYRVPEATDSMV